MKIGIAPRVTYDFEKDEIGFLMPIYLLRDSKGNLTGGASVGWQSYWGQVRVKLLGSDPIKSLFSAFQPCLIPA